MCQDQVRVSRYGVCQRVQWQNCFVNVVVRTDNQSVLKIHIWLSVTIFGCLGQPDNHYYEPCAILPESTAPFQNIPPFSTTICGPPIIYPSLPEYTPLFNKHIIMRGSQNLSTLPENTPTLSTNMCDTPRIYPSLTEYNSLFNNYMRPSQYLTIPPGIHPPPTSFSTTMLLCNAHRTYPSLPEYTFPLFNNYMRHSQNLPLHPRIYPPFQHLYVTLSESIHPYLPESTTPLFNKCIYTTLP